MSLHRKRIPLGVPCIAVGRLRIAPFMNSASNHSPRWFCVSKPGNILGSQHGGRSVDLRVRGVDYWPFPETLILICFGLDSSRFAICRVKTPLRYSARMFSELTVFGREKLRVNGP